MEQIAANGEKLKKQFTHLFGENSNISVVNNYDWLSKLDLLGFLRDYGKLFSINVMLAKDVVASRLDAGISFTEFSYQILQSVDFHHLLKTYDVQLQIGGADQWGNITSGIDMIHKIEGAEQEAYGLTIPLMLKSDGTKFGKTAGGAIWLDPEKTSPFEFYQFWLNQDDADVVRYLKFFTFLGQKDIEELATAVLEEPEKRLAQRRLAEEVTRFVHDDAALEEAQRITEALYHGSIAELKKSELEQAFGKMPTVTVGADEKNIVDWLVDSTIYKSKRQAREDVQNGAVTINGVRVTDLDAIVTPHKNSEGKYIIVRKGKKTYTLAKVKE